MTTDQRILEVRNLRVGFRRRRRDPMFFALDDVSLAVQRGHTMGLIGESGSGKSTLANAVLGLVPIQSGTVSLLGDDITRLAPAARRRLGRSVQAVFQDPNNSLNPSWKVARSLAEPVRALGTRSRVDINARTIQMLEDVGLDPAAARRFPRQFSGGQRQRISIARALMTAPQLVICDEAVSALDLSVQAQILNLLTDLQREHNLSYLFISHNMSVVRHACHDVTVLYRGQVMEAGPTAAVTANPAHPYTRALLLAVPVPDPAVQRRSRTDASPIVEQRLPSVGCPFASRCPFSIAICRDNRPTLQPLPDGRLVACHRYPEWRNEVASVVTAPSSSQRRPAADGDVHSATVASSHSVPPGQSSPPSSTA